MTRPLRSSFAVLLALALGSVAFPATTAPAAADTPRAASIPGAVAQSPGGTASSTSPSDPPLAASARPRILIQPKPAATITGRQARFAVKAARVGTYRWQRNTGDGWASISGATSRVYHVRSTPGRAGQYRVRVSNAGGRTYSRSVALTVYPATVMTGHRGDMSKSRPEQTAAAFAAARKAGADTIELDVRWTSDDRMVLLHDNTLDRTTDCTGPVETSTFRSVRACDAGSWVSEKFAGTKVPTFEEVLAYAHRHQLMVYAEIKTETLTRGQATAYLDAIQDADMVGRVVMASFSPTTIATFRSVDAQGTVPTCWIDLATPTPDEIRATGSTHFLATVKSLTPERMAALHAAGITVLAGPASTHADYARVEALHVDEILVNSVDKYRAWLRRQN